MVVFEDMLPLITKIIKETDLNKVIVSSPKDYLSPFIKLLSKLKDKYIVYDFIDCFDKSCSTKSIYRQGLEKIKIYEKNRYDNKIKSVTIWIIIIIYYICSMSWIS